MRTQPADVIIGNPPWGITIPSVLRDYFNTRYETYGGVKTDTYELFLEQAVHSLRDKGRLYFIVPESLLNVKSRGQTRQFLLEHCSFEYVAYLGDAFSGVQCPSIILGVKKETPTLPGVKKVVCGNTIYTIRQNRQISTQRFNFHVRDHIQDCLDTIEAQPSVFLHGNATFAMGIVTEQLILFAKGTWMNQLLEDKM